MNGCKGVLVGLALLLLARGAYAEPLVDRAEISHFGGYAQIKVYFNEPISIEQVNPRTHGAMLQVRIGRQSAQHFTAEAARNRWVAGPQPSATTLYEYLRFDPAPGGGVIGVKFLKPLEYAVYAGADARSVVIAVMVKALPDERALATVADAPPRSQPPPSSTPTPVLAATAAPAVAALVDTVPAPVAHVERQPAAKPAQSLANPPQKQKAMQAATESVIATSVIPDDPLDNLLALGQQAMLAGDYDRAVALYTRIVEHGDVPQAREALEYLGVAREKKQQFAHAKAIYTDYLKRYPQGADAGRVRQRLAALLALYNTPRAPLAAEQSTRRAESEYFGSFSQYYRYADLSIDRSVDNGFDDSESLTTLSALITRIDANARLRGEDWDLRSRVAGGYVADFQERQNTVGSYALLNDAYVDVRQRSADFSLKLGRQHSSKGGVVGRFNGAIAGIPLNELLHLNLVGGVPVDLARNMTVDDTERYFYGVNVDIAAAESRWQHNLFVLQQQIDGMVDRAPVGAETRFAGEKTSLFLRGEYDVEFNELSGAMLIGSWRVREATSIGFNADYRYNPLLSTRNALIGELGVTSIDQLRDRYSEDEIRELAMNRSASSHYNTLSVTHDLTDNWQLYGSASQFSYDDLPASGDLPAISGTGDEYELDIELIGSNLWYSNDTTSFGMRHFDGSRLTRQAVGVDSRFFITDRWRINPRLWVELRQMDADGSEQWVYRPRLRLEYIPTRRLHIEFEISSDISTRDIPTEGSEDITGNFAEIGYWYEF